MAHRPCPGDVERARTRRALRAAGGDGPALLVLHLHGAVQAARVLPRRARPRAVPRGQAARDHSRRFLLDPAALEHHHGAVELLSRPRPRSAGRGAGGLAHAVWCEAAGDGSELELDGAADGHPDVCGVRGGVSRRAAVSAHRARGLHPLPRGAGSDRQRPHARARERVPGAPHEGHPQRHCRAGRRRHRSPVPDHPSRAPGAAGGVPVARGVRGDPPHADVALLAERVGAARGTGVVELPAGLDVRVSAVEHGGGGVRARRAAAPSALQHRLQQGAGERAEVRSRGHHAPGRTASALAAQHPQA